MFRLWNKKKKMIFTHRDCLGPQPWLSTARLGNKQHLTLLWMHVPVQWHTWHYYHLYHYCYQFQLWEFISSSQGSHMWLIEKYFCDGKFWFFLLWKKFLGQIFFLACFLLSQVVFFHRSCYGFEYFPFSKFYFIKMNIRTL